MMLAVKQNLSSSHLQNDILLEFSFKRIYATAGCNILVSQETGGGNCLPYVLAPPSLSCKSGG